jgi:hypothetical protein
MRRHRWRRRPRRSSRPPPHGAGSEIDKRSKPESFATVLTRLPSMNVRPPRVFRIAVALSLWGLTAAVCPAATLFTDNFNIPDTGSLDGSDQTGRHTGLLTTDLVLRSGGVQHTITGNRLDFLLAGFDDGRVRFHDTNNLGNLWNFAFGVGGSQILADGGLRIEFDWTPADNTSDNWISYSIGINGFDAAFRVANPSTDFGVLFRNNGGTQLFDNGGPTTGPTFNVSTVTTHHAQLDFSFGSFADETTVNLQGFVDGVLLGAGSFQWNGNAGVLNMEIGNLAAGTKLDNVSISTIPEPSSAALLAGVGLLAGARRRRAT